MCQDWTTALQPGWQSETVSQQPSSKLVNNPWGGQSKKTEIKDWPISWKTVKLSVWGLLYYLPLFCMFESFRLGTVAQAYNPSTLEGRGGWITRSTDRDHPGQHGETPCLLKTQKISWAWWRVPVIPATREAEAGELPEPRRRRLRWAEIAPLHSSLGNKSETPSQ